MFFTDNLFPYCSYFLVACCLKFCLPLLRFMVRRREKISNRRKTWGTQIKYSMYQNTAHSKAGIFTYSSHLINESNLLLLCCMWEGIVNIKIIFLEMFDGLGALSPPKYEEVVFEMPFVCVFLWIWKCLADTWIFWRILNPVRYLNFFCHTSMRGEYKKYSFMKRCISPGKINSKWRYSEKLF